MKTLLLTLDNHFFRYQNQVYYQHITSRTFFEKYCQVFDRVFVMARCKDVDHLAEDMTLLDLPDKVQMVFVPMFQGIKSLLKVKAQVEKIARDLVAKEQVDVLLVRLPSFLGFIVADSLAKVQGLVRAGEVVSSMAQKKGDGWTKLGLQKRIMHQWMVGHIKKLDGCAYVTQKVLQDLYPNNKITAAYSSIDLEAEDFYDRPRGSLNPLNLVHVSTLQSNSKGVDVFIEVVHRLHQKGYPVHGVIVGGGRYYPSTKEDLASYDYFSVVGNQPRQALRQLYHQAGILLFPSQFEGLPRAVIEAMAMGLVVVSSNVDGLVELVEPKLRFDPKDVDAYQKTIEMLIKDETLCYLISQRNYHHALNFQKDKLQALRNDFFEKLLSK